MKKSIIIIVLLSMVILTMAAEELFTGTAGPTNQDINAAAKAFRINGTDLNTGAFAFPTQMVRAQFNIGGNPNATCLTPGAAIIIQGLIIDTGGDNDIIVFTDTFTMPDNIVDPGEVKLAYTSPAFLAVNGQEYSFWIISDNVNDTDIQIDAGGSLLVSDDAVTAGKTNNHLNTNVVSVGGETPESFDDDAADHNDPGSLGEKINQAGGFHYRR